MSKENHIVDLFSGCGGFGLGAELSGFNTFIAMDIDKTLQSSYKLNFPKCKVLNDDLAITNSDSWKNYLGKTEIDGVIGGPPCQGYSRMGNSDQTDPRRSLLGHFFRNVNLIDPKFFIMENVEGLLDKKNVGELTKALEVVDPKYIILDPIILDATNFGAPTRRRRVIVIGYNPKHVKHSIVSDFLPTTLNRVSVIDAIADLPTPIKQAKVKGDLGWTTYPKKSDISSYAISMRKLPKRGIGNPDAIKKLRQNKVSGLFNTIHSELVLERYSSLKQGEIDKVSRAKRLAWEGVCPTLRAGTGSDKGSHQAVRPLHPDQNRVITVREAARLQGFPDWFIFHPTKWHSFRMIGNSVSPLVSKFILEQMKKKLK